MYPCGCERRALAQARHRRAHAHEECRAARLRLRGTPLEHRERRRRAAEAAGHADGVGRLRALARHDLLLALSPPDCGHRHRQRRCCDYVATRDDRPARCGERARAAHELERVLRREAVGQAEHEVRLARVHAHRREVR